MSSMTYFYQQCPVCGRSLRIPVKYFGREMSCTHCGGHFHAAPSGERGASDPAEPLASTDESTVHALAMTATAR